MASRRTLLAISCVACLLYVLGFPSPVGSQGPQRNRPTEGVGRAQVGASGALAPSIDSLGAADQAALLSALPYARRALVVESEFDAVRVDHAAELAPRQAITLEVWLKHRQPRGCGTLVSKGRATSYWLGLCDGRLRFEIAGRQILESSTTVAEGRWTHVAVSYQQPTARLYVNGVLDRENTNAREPLADGNADLILGADAGPGLALRGILDHARLWSLVRSAAEIAANDFAVLSPQAGLVAQWELDGSARDSVGRHDGRAESGGLFTYDGAVPRDLAIPTSAATITVDGRCDPAEYSQAQRLAVDAAEPPLVLALASASDIYVCFHRMARPRSGSGVTQVYLDRNLSRGEVAQASDYRFGINQRSIAEARQGDGAGGWRDLALPAGTWQATQVTDQDSWSAEYRLPRSFLDRPVGPDEPFRFGLAIGMTADVPVAADYYWPVRTVANAPRTWSVVTLADRVSVLPRATFRGRCVRFDSNDRPVGIPGATLQLFAVREAGATLVATTQSDSGGRYELEYRGEWPDRFLVRQFDARGTYSVRSEAGLRGTAVAANVLQYEISRNESASWLAFSDGLFVDDVGQPHLGRAGPLYLVVYADPISAEDLTALVAARQGQGFEVITVSTADLARIGQGRDLAEQIRNWLVNQWRYASGRAVYALLIGRGDKIPIRDVGWMDNDHRDPASPRYYPAWPTDWYYADLDSDWDADGDGYFGELMRCKPGDKYPDPEGEKTCPESGNLLREGPYGALRSPEDDFRPEISIGRIAANEPGEVRRALTAMLAAESVAGSDKQRALLAGSLYSFKGRSWSAAAGASVVGGSVEANPWVGAPWDGLQPLGYDAAVHLETRLKPLLQPFMLTISRQYESTVPETGLEYLAPSAFVPDAALSPDALAQAWANGRYGLVNLAGRGGPTEVSAARWIHDWDRNQIIDQPASPGTCAGQTVNQAGRVGPPCDELIAEAIADSRLPIPNGPPPVVVASSSQSGAVAWRWKAMDRSQNVLGLRYGPAALASLVPGRGLASAWVGSMMDVWPGHLDDFQLAVNRGLVEQSLRLGDAVWLANAELASAEPYDIRSYGVQLFGDPAQSYWGNPLDASGAWPQDGRDWQASNASPYVGPSLPERVWRASDSGPNSAPSIGGRGEILVAGQDGLLRIATSGLLLNRITLSGATAATNRYPPAVGVDGAYVALGNTLYVLDANLGLREQVRLPAGATVNGAPRIGPDGSVWVPTRLGMARVTGHGGVTMFGGGEAAIGAMAVLPTGEVVWSSGADAVAVCSIDREGKATQDEIAESGMRNLTPLAVAPSGQMYVGSSTGRLYAINRRGAVWQVDTGSAISARPAVGSDGSVYVGTARGSILAYGPSGGREAWRRDLGTAIRATPSLDHGYLYVAAGSELIALHLATGHLAWRIDLGGTTDERSTPVIGADRTLYVLRSDQTLVAIREAGWLPAPSEVRVTSGPDRLTVDWRDNASEETGYRVELCGPDGWCFSPTDVAANVTRASLRRLPVAPGKPVYARVLALGAVDEHPVLLAVPPGSDDLAGGRADQSAKLLAADANLASAYGWSRWTAPLPTEPAAVRGLRAEGAYADAIQLQWRYEADGSQLEGFEILRALAAAGPFTSVAFVAPEAREYLDEGLAPSSTYYYRVAAVGDAGAAEPPTISATTKPETLRPPSEVSLTVGHESFTLRWRDNATDETGYVVQRRGPGSARYETVGLLGVNAQSFTDSAYILRGTYHYRLKAVGRAADSSYVSTMATLGGPRVAWLYIPFVLQRR